MKAGEEEEAETEVCGVYGKERHTVERGELQIYIVGGAGSLAEMVNAY